MKTVRLEEEQIITIIEELQNTESTILRDIETSKEAKAYEWKLYNIYKTLKTALHSKDAPSIE